MSETEAQACATPLADLRRDALAHYDEISSQAHHWSSVIPRAINFYFDAEEAKARPSLPDAGLSDERLAEIRQWYGDDSLVRELLAEIARTRSDAARLQRIAAAAELVSDAWGDIPYNSPAFGSIITELRAALLSRVPEERTRT